MPAIPLPDGYHNVNAYLVIAGVEMAIDFLTRVFGARETERITGPNGTIAHAEVRIGDSIIMMGEAQGEWKAMPAMLYVYVDDTDAAYQRALEAGATSMMEPADMFYGDRNAGVKDSAGNLWWIATHQENVPPEDLQRRAEETMKTRTAQ